LAAAHLPGPEQPKPLAVPVDHRLRFHDHQGRPPAGSVPRQTGPEKSVRSGQLGSLHRAQQNVELMAKSEHLHLAERHECEGNRAPLPKRPLTKKLG
jgi:hypothetical protein